MSEPIPQALPTYYGGITFRSRLEARWAVFMDYLRIEWRYEPDGFALPSGNYLVDFHLPKLDCFLEIKPTKPEPEEISKASDLSNLTGKKVFILVGPPMAAPEFDPQSGFAIAYYSGDEDRKYLWCECPHCKRVELQFDGRADRINCNCPKSAHGDKGYNHDSDRLKKAASLALSHRFGT